MIKPTRRVSTTSLVTTPSSASLGRRLGNELIFAHQPAEGGPGLTDEELIALASEAGADGDDVAAGIRDLRFGDWVAEATDRASQDGLTGTPWVLVDGTPLRAPSAETVAAAVQAAAG